MLCPRLLSNANLFTKNMSVYKRYNGKRVSSSHPDYSKARWWIYKRLKGKVIHQSIPEAKTKQEAELAERQIIKASFDHSYNVTDTITTLASFIDEKYRPYVQQNNVNKGAKSTRGPRNCTSGFYLVNSRSRHCPASFLRTAGTAEPNFRLDRTNARKKVHSHQHPSIASCPHCRRYSASRVKREFWNATRCST